VQPIREQEMGYNVIDINWEEVENFFEGGFNSNSLLIRDYDNSSKICTHRPSLSLLM